MAVEPVRTSASSRPVTGAAGLRLLVRVLLALLALWLLAIAGDRYVAFRNDAAAFFRMDGWLWLSWTATALGAGILFGLAACLPFTRTRYRWNRLVLAALALAPLVQFWWVFIFQLGRHGVAGGWISRADWLMEPQTQSALAVLAGVAIASGLTPKDDPTAT